MKIPDPEAQFAAERRYRLGLRESLQKAVRSSRHDVIDVVRTALWYSEIAQCLCVFTVYQVEKHMEPDAFDKNSFGDPYHRNKWSAYRIGRHKPHRRLIIQAEEKVPGSAFFIDHVLWDAIRGRKKLDWLINIGLKQLSKDVQKVLYKGDHFAMGDKLVPRLMKQHLRQLERRAGFDALAALVIFLRLTNAQNDRERALEIGESIYRVLLIVCTHLPFANLRSEIFALFRMYVFPMARDEHRGIVVSANFDFGEATLMLNRLCLQLEDANQIGVSYRDGVRAKCHLLDGKWGFHIQFALAPPIALLALPSKSNAHAHRLTASAERFREWGWRMLRTGGKEILPPHELW